MTNKSEGLKFDTGKPMVGSMLQIFPRALLAVGGCVSKGREKYPNIDNWQYVENGIVRYRDALMRHLIKYSMGIDIDEESGQPHLAHVAWNALAILELYLQEHQEIVDEYIK